MKKLTFISLFLAVILASCGNRPNFMQYEVVFYAPLGDSINDIGSNIPLLTNYFTNSSDFIIGDYLDVPHAVDIFKNKLYIADKYNKRISVFPLSPEGSSNTFSLGTSGDGYSFNIPFQVVLNKYGEIYVLASLSNIDIKYNSNEIEQDDMNYVETNQMKGFNNYYIYKFSPDGKFVYAIGNNGIHSEPMDYPERIDIDLFDNLYAFYKTYENDKEIWMVKRFSPSGELSFEFSTKYISSTNTKGDRVFVGRISDIYNLKNDERLMIYTDYYSVKKNNIPIETPDETYHSLDVYSILQNAITKNIFQTKKYVDQFIKITKDDILVLYSYDEKYHGIRFRFIDISSPMNNEEVYYAPILSDNNANFGFYVDDYGQIYSILVKDNAYFVLVRWKKVKSKALS